MTATLEVQARQFAADLSETVCSLAPDCSPFRAKTHTDSAPERFSVRQDPDTGIPLSVDGEALLTLRVSYFCCLDGQDSYLAVDGSKITVHAGGTNTQREPLFRYEYVRGTQSDIPAAHIQVHAHRDGISYVMNKAGYGTTRGQRRANNSDVPAMQELHFPLGGHRFRPCLEDVLEMLVTELGVDCPPGGREALRQGREAWGRKQTRSVVRDAPDEAIAVLEELGYDVDLRDGFDKPPGTHQRLTDF